MQDAGGGWKNHVRRGRGHDDQVEILGLAPGGLERSAGGVQGQVAAVDAVFGEVPRTDAGAFGDPRVTRLQPAPRQHGGHVVVVAMSSLDRRRGGR